MLHGKNKENIYKQLNKCFTQGQPRKNLDLYLLREMSKCLKTVSYIPVQINTEKQTKENI